MTKILSLSKRESESGVKLLNYLFEHPIVTTRSVMKTTGFTRAGAQRVIDRFIDLNILVKEKKETKYDVKYTYKEYFTTFIR